MRAGPSRDDASTSLRGDRTSDASDRLDAPGAGGRASARYHASVKDLTVSEVDRRRLQNPQDRTIYREVARQFGVGEQSLRLWVKKKDAARMGEGAEPFAGADTGPAEPLSPEQMKAELQLLRRQIQKLRTENEVLKRAFVVFSSEWGGET